MNLGILKVAAALEELGVKVENLDLSGIENYNEALAAHLSVSDAKVLGISTTTPQLPNVVKLVQTIRSLRPDIKIILGGPHVTLTHAAYKYEKKMGRVARAHGAMTHLENLVDVLVSGDGELAVFSALLPDAPKIIDGDDPQQGMFMSNEIYENTPLPARHLVDVASYRYDIEGRKSTSLIAQLGCPFGCGFCGGRFTKSLRMIRTRSSESIVEEVKNLYLTYGFTGFMFYDDELNVNKNMVDLMNKIADLQSKLGVDFRLRGFVKAQLFNDEQAAAMYRAGFRWILTGFESGAPKILDNINKKATRDDNTRTVEFARKHGLKVKALMSIGHPGESEETVRQTQEWLLESKPDEFDCTIITTYPGTPYYDEALPHGSLKNVWTYTAPRSGDKLHAYEVDYLTTSDYYKGDPKGGYRAFVFSDTLSAEDLVARRDWIESSVRSALNIPFPKSRPALRFEHSMGQGANSQLPPNILRISKPERHEGSHDNSQHYITSL